MSTSYEQRYGVEEESEPIWKSILSFIGFFLATVMVTILFQFFIGRVYIVPSGSMEPTLHGCEGCNNDRIFAEKISLYANSIEQGDVVVFKGTPSWEKDAPEAIDESRLLQRLNKDAPTIYTKRVLATGGQTVSCKPGDTAIMVDGIATNQDFTNDATNVNIDPEYGSQACGGYYINEFTVPEDHYFMVGDNRFNSLDSRFRLDDGLYGSIPKGNLVGKVRTIIYPLPRIDIVTHHDL